MELGVVGKPNVGKSTFFAAATLAPVHIANYPFTTVQANHGVAYVRKKCPHLELGRPCKPNNAPCQGGSRLIPELGQRGTPGRPRGNASRKDSAGKADRPRIHGDADSHGPAGGSARSENGALDLGGPASTREVVAAARQADDPRREQSGSRALGYRGQTGQSPRISHDSDVRRVRARSSPRGDGIPHRVRAGRAFVQDPRTNKVDGQPVEGPPCDSS